MIAHATTSIDTPRRILREFRGTDLDAMHAVMGNAQVMRFSLNGPYSLPKTQEFMEGCLLGYSKRGVGLFAVVHRGDEKVISYCGLYFPVIDGTEFLSFHITRE
jgi:ribosomal-protein-alanine N-acetyltransferase